LNGDADSKRKFDKNVNVSVSLGVNGASLNGFSKEPNVSLRVPRLNGF